MSTQLSQICPHCKYAMNLATDPFGDENKPDGGDVTLCIRCGEWAVFNDDLTLRPPTDDEYISIGRNKDCDRLRSAWLELMEQRE